MVGKKRKKKTTAEWVTSVWAREGCKGRKVGWLVFSLLKKKAFSPCTFLHSPQANTSSNPQIGTCQRAASLQNWVKYTKQQYLMAPLFFHTNWPRHGNRSARSLSPFFFFSSGFRKLLEGKSNILSWWGDRRGADMPTGRGSWEKPQTGRAWLTLTPEVKAGGSVTERCFQATLRPS